MYVIALGRLLEILMPEY